MTTSKSISELVDEKDALIVEKAEIQRKIDEIEDLIRSQQKSLGWSYTKNGLINSDNIKVRL